MPSLRTLDPSWRHLAETWFKRARSHYDGLTVTSARRTYNEQLRLYQAAQRGQNNGLPATPPGSSDHERGLAFDMARVNVDPKADPVLQHLGALWNAVSTRQGHGYWWSGDPVHFGWRPVRRKLRGRLRRGL